MVLTLFLVLVLALFLVLVLTLVLVDLLKTWTCEFSWLRSWKAPVFEKQTDLEVKAGLLWAV